MPRLRATHRPIRPTSPRPKEPQRLPQRWAIIAMVTAAAAIIAYPAGGPIAAITVGSVVLVAAHRILG